MATGGLHLLLCVQFSHALGWGHSEALKFRKRLASGLFCAPPGRPALWFPPGTALQVLPARLILLHGPRLPVAGAGRSSPAVYLGSEMLQHQLSWAPPWSWWLGPQTCLQVPCASNVGLMA